VIDLMILIAFVYALLILMAFLAVALGSELVTAPVIIIASFSPFLYFILFEGLWNGQTPGKRALRLRVRMSDGTPLTFGAALMRNLIRTADLLPGTYFLGLIVMFTNNQSQRLGDMAAGTVVVHEAKTIATFQAVPPRVVVHPLEEHIGEVQRMTDSEYAVLRRLRDRFVELPPAIQERMLRDVWTPIAITYGIPMLEGIHPVHLIEAAIVKYEREHGLL
jgi:uncharacterized RDD family membrane protein YckC